jgi:hypothetical protein
MSEEEDAISAMRQRLMTADEVYVYKIPPLKDSGGHRYGSFSDSHRIHLPICQFDLNDYKFFCFLQR